LQAATAAARYTSTRIRVPQRIVQHVGVAVQRLRIRRARHNRIRADEASQLRVVIARAVVHQPRARVNALSCERVIRWQCAVAGARRAKRVVRLPRDERAARVARNAGGTQVVAVEVGDARAGAHRDALAAKVVVLGDRARLRHLKPVADVVGGGAARRARQARGAVLDETDGAQVQARLSGLWVRAR